MSEAFESIMRGLREVREMEKIKTEYKNVVLTLEVPGFEDFHYVQPMTQEEIDIVYDEKDLTHLCGLFFDASKFIKNNRANLLLRKPNNE